MTPNAATVPPVLVAASCSMVSPRTGVLSVTRKTAGSASLSSATNSKMNYAPMAGATIRRTTVRIACHHVAPEVLAALSSSRPMPAKAG